MKLSYLIFCLFTLGVVKQRYIEITWVVVMSFVFCPCKLYFQVLSVLYNQTAYVDMKMYLKLLLMRALKSGRYYFYFSLSFIFRSNVNTFRQTCIGSTAFFRLRDYRTYSLKICYWLHLLYFLSYLVFSAATNAEVELRVLFVFFFLVSLAKETFPKE